MTSELRDLVLGALDDAGGRAYLKEQAEKSPAAFMALVGRCLPKDVNLNGEIHHTLERLLLGQLSEEVSEDAGQRTLSS